jgi:hypothetical protein
MPNREIRTLRGSRRARPLSFAPIVALAILAVGIAYAQQNLPVPPKPAKPAAAEPAPADTAAAADAEPAAGTEPQDGASTAVPSPTTGKGSPQRFEPTEKVRPDFDVAFPVDI